VLVEKSLCCGCNACTLVCPTGAITIKTDDFGFAFSNIDAYSCVNCGACEKVCPAMNKPDFSGSFEQTAFAASSLDISSKESSSGGIFALLAKHTLSDGGVVFGTTLDENFDAKVIEIEKLDDLPKLQGSKYVQSDMGNVYNNIKQKLKEDTAVLFCGTPCQISAVRNFIGENAKLFLVDIVCHGVPSNQMFKEYIDLEGKKTKSNIVDFKFRDKKYGQDTVGKIVYKNKTKKLRSFESSFYANFLSCNIFRESCYKCRYADIYRPGDITLCDFWGVAEMEPSIVDECNKANITGISGVIINTKKGEQIFEKIKKNIVYKATQVKKISKYNPNLKSPSHIGKNREIILDLYQKSGYKAVDSYYHNQYRYINLIKKIYHIMPNSFKKIISKIRG